MRMIVNEQILYLSKYSNYDSDLLCVLHIAEQLLKLDFIDYSPLYHKLDALIALFDHKLKINDDLFKIKYNKRMNEIVLYYLKIGIKMI